jgi:predicted nucleic acid-binding protein
VNFVDTSAWIEFLRPSGSRTIQGNLQSLIQAGAVAITEWVILEVMVGIRASETVPEVLSRLAHVHRLAFQEDHWAQAWDLAARLRKKGVTPSASDCLIATIAIASGATLIHCDTDFELIAKYEKKLQTMDWTKLL